MKSEHIYSDHPFKNLQKMKAFILNDSNQYDWYAYYIVIDLLSDAIKMTLYITVTNAFKVHNAIISTANHKRSI